MNLASNHDETSSKLETAKNVQTTEPNVFVSPEEGEKIKTEANKETQTHLPLEMPRILENGVVVSVHAHSIGQHLLLVVQERVGTEVIGEVGALVHLPGWRSRHHRRSTPANHMPIHGSSSSSSSCSCSYYHSVARPSVATPH